MLPRRMLGLRLGAMLGLRLPGWLARREPAVDGRRDSGRDDGVSLVTGVCMPDDRADSPTSSGPPSAPGAAVLVVRGDG